MPSILIEACVDSLPAAERAIAGGAGRLELCDFSVPGGQTPAPALVESVLAISPIPVHVLVRPRVGNEAAMLMREVSDFRAVGVHGVVIGALTAAGEVDQQLTAELRRMAQHLSVTFHRGFDEVPDPTIALDVLVSLRVDRVLTAGHAPTAEAGIPGLAELVRRARGRIGVIAAGGIREHNVARIVRETGVSEMHSRGDIGAIQAALRAG